MKNLTKVTWLDISSNGEWVNLENAVKWGESQWALGYSTVGYLIEKNRKYLLLAGSYYEEDDKIHYNDISFIPLKVVKKIEKI